MATTRRYVTQVWVFLKDLAEVNKRQGIVDVWNDTAETLIAAGKAQALNAGALLLRPIENVVRPAPLVAQAGGGVVGGGGGSTPSADEPVVDLGITAAPAPAKTTRARKTA